MLAEVLVQVSGGQKLPAVLRGSGLALIWRRWFGPDPCQLGPCRHDHPTRGQDLSTQRCGPDAASFPGCGRSQLGEQFGSGVRVALLHHLQAVRPRGPIRGG